MFIRYFIRCVITQEISLYQRINNYYCFNYFEPVNPIICVESYFTIHSKPNTFGLRNHII